MKSALARRLWELDSSSWSLEDYEWELATDSSRLFEWRHSKGEGEGFVLYRVEASELWIMHWAVSPRGRGFGELAFEAFLRSVDALSWDSIELEVRASNVAARRLYERFGFEVVGERSAYYKDGETAVLYRWTRRTDP